MASLKRELLRMGQIIEIMATPVMEIYSSGNKEHIKAVCDKDKTVNAGLDNIRRYVAAMPIDKMKPEDAKRAREMTEYAIALETAGDIIAKRLMPLAIEIAGRGVHFSPAGQEELIGMHERVMANMGLASNVLVSDDIESARLLLEEKTEMTRMERASRKKHLKRLSDGAEVSFDSSDIHLETLRSFKDINSQISVVAYPILIKGGQLLETRLIAEIEASDLT
jgi:phosphate:Na+ symporter